MDPTSLETVSRWASAAAVVLSALAAIAITIAAYASSRVLTVTNARAAQVRAESARAVVAVDATATEAEEHSRAAPAVVGEPKSDDRPPQAELTRTTGSKPESAESPVATTGQAMIAVLHAAILGENEDLPRLIEPELIVRSSTSAPNPRKAQK